MVMSVWRQWSRKEEKLIRIEHGRASNLHDSVVSTKHEVCSCTQ